MRQLGLALLFGLLTTSGGSRCRAQDRSTESHVTVEVVPGRDGTVQITDRGRIVTVPRMASQTGIEGVQVRRRPDGWLACRFQRPRLRESIHRGTSDLARWAGHPRLPQ